MFFCYKGCFLYFQSVPNYCCHSLDILATIRGLHGIIKGLKINLHMREEEQGRVGVRLMRTKLIDNVPCKVFPPGMEVILHRASTKKRQPN